MDSACDTVFVFGPYLDSEPASCITPAASFFVVRFESRFRGDQHILHPGVPVYDPLVITKKLKRAQGPLEYAIPFEDQLGIVFRKDVFRA
jgi:hypothetical protein